MKTGILLASAGDFDAGGWTNGAEISAGTDPKNSRSHREMEFHFADRLPFPQRQKTSVTHSRSGIGWAGPNNGFANAAITAADGMLAPGVENPVTLFTGSDFGRTLTSNDRGSDHA